MFDYDRVLQIAARLEELGIPAKTIYRIRRWADRRRRYEERQNRIRILFGGDIMPKMITYLIKQISLKEPKIVLPEGSIVVSFVHWGASGERWASGPNTGDLVPESWEVTYLEPVRRK